MDNDHGITDELREYATDAFYVGDPEHINLCIIADHIEAELAERYIELPKDADGEYIHVEDMLVDGLSQGFAPKKVKMLALEDNEWMLNFGGGWCAMKHHEWHHYHAPTVEDVLHELTGKALMLSEVDGENALVAEYAKKLQLRGDAE